MKMTTVVLSLTVLAGMAFFPCEKGGVLGAGLAWAAPQQAEGQKPATWSSREEYDLYVAFSTEKDPHKRIGLGEAFLQKHPDTFIKDNCYVIIMQAYVQLNDVPKAMGAAHKAVEVNPEKLEALNYLAYVFPFIFDPKDPEAESKLAQAEKSARMGLEALQKLKKPEQATEDQFNQFVKVQRSNYNSAIGFIALQRKDYPAAIASFKAAAEDNPADVYIFYRLGIAYISDEPRDINNGIWNLSRSVALAKAGKNPAAAEIEKYLRSVYIDHHGYDEGLAGILAQAATSPAPPEGFSVSQMEVPEDTGNSSIDAFNQDIFLAEIWRRASSEIMGRTKGPGVWSGWIH